jgi:hypothetical protein
MIHRQVLGKQADKKIYRSAMKDVLLNAGIYRLNLGAMG